jgi:predicted flap endonuclease-1-like 5' DNA nuclease
MWQEWWKRWMELAFWWLPRQEQPRQEQPRQEQPREQPPRQGQGAADTRVEPARDPGPTAASEPPPPEPPPAEPPPPEPPPPEPRAATPTAPAAPDPTPPPAAGPAAPDDLTAIKGIGPATQDRLRALGIATYGDLAAADPDAIAERLKGAQPISAQLVRSWTEAARTRTAG